MSCTTTRRTAAELMSRSFTTRTSLLRGRGGGTRRVKFRLSLARNDATRTQPTTQTMRITVNGQTETLDEELTVADLLARRDLQPVRVAVEINEDLVPRAAFRETPIRSGDCVEIVTFVGGG